MKSSLPNMILSLTGLTLVAGASLGFVNYITAEPIAAAAEKAKIEAMEEILPPFDSFEIVESNGLALYPASSNKQFSGIAFETYSDDGFGGRIVIMAGFGADGSLTGYRVLSHAETPGLGSKMDSWFMNDQVIGSSDYISVRADGGNVDAITGATITSRAFTDAINRARKAYNSYKNESR